MNYLNTKQTAQTNLDNNSFGKKLSLINARLSWIEGGVPHPMAYDILGSSKSKSSVIRDLLTPIDAVLDPIDHQLCILKLKERGITVLDDVLQIDVSTIIRLITPEASAKLYAEINYLGLGNAHTDPSALKEAFNNTFKVSKENNGTDIQQLIHTADKLRDQEISTIEKSNFLSLSLHDLRGKIGNSSITALEEEAGICKVHQVLELSPLDLLTLINKSDERMRFSPDQLKKFYAIGRSNGLEVPSDVEVDQAASRFRSLRSHKRAARKKALEQKD